ncbi:polar amino acid transport system substrate-binding protein [Oxalobacteraceae bacterium GrIS 1.11]
MGILYRLARRLRLLLAGLWLSGGGAGTAATLHITTENSPPYNMQQGELIVGSGTDKVRQLMARAGIDYRIELLSWMRAYTLALHEADTCVYSTTRTPERETLFKWVGPLTATEWTLFGLGQRAFKLRDIDDARLLKIGTYNGDVRDDYLRARGFSVEAVQNELSNPKKLLMNRIDLWATSKATGSAILAQNGWGKRIVPVLTFRQVELYLACNPALPDDLIRHMNAALEKMKLDGTAKNIDRKYDGNTAK